jgi:hypothetical protein
VRKRKCFPFFAVQVFLVLMVFLAVPTMLIPKPLILLYQHKQELKKKAERTFEAAAVPRLL